MLSEQIGAGEGHGARDADARGVAGDGARHELFIDLVPRSFTPVMYVPAQPRPVSARVKSADQNPSARKPNRRWPTIVQPTPKRYTTFASTRSVAVTRTGTDSMYAR